MATTLLGLQAAGKACTKQPLTSRPGVKDRRMKTSKPVTRARRDWLIDKAKVAREEKKKLAALRKRLR